MGQIIHAKCAQCGFEKEFYIGGGLKDSDITTMLAALPKEGQRILTIAARRSAKQMSITRKLCICDACGTIYALPVVEYTLEGKREELRGVCPQCDGTGCRMVDTTQATTGRPETNVDHQVRCPDCGASLALQLAGYWD